MLRRPKPVAVAVEVEVALLVTAARVLYSENK
jgi:hypothetical protein